LMLRCTTMLSTGFSLTYPEKRGAASVAHRRSQVQFDSALRHRV
jgi:hypothetical protein